MPYDETRAREYLAGIGRRLEIANMDTSLWNAPRGYFNTALRGITSASFDCGGAANARPVEPRRPRLGGLARRTGQCSPGIRHIGRRVTRSGGSGSYDGGAGERRGRKSESGFAGPRPGI